MGNIKNYNFNFLKLKLTNSDYWDYTLSNDNRYILPQTSVVQDGLLLDFDFDNHNTFTGVTSATTISSLTSWDEAVNNGIILKDIGLTGVDNGLVIFETLSGDTGHTALVNAMLTSTLEIPTGQTDFFMTRVTGSTGDYIYPMGLVSDTGMTYGGDYMSFSGGFYQGYYALDEYEYQVLPNRVNKGWVYDFWLRPSSTKPLLTGVTLNDVYPGNTGMFFYLGTRSENKFWSIFSGNSSGCSETCLSGCSPIATSGITSGVSECFSASTSGCSSGLTLSVPGGYCTVLKETDINTSDDYPLSPPPLQFTKIDNKFMFYHRGNGYGCGGKCQVDNPPVYSGFTYSGGTDFSGITPYSLYNLTDRNMDVDYLRYDFTNSKYDEFFVGIRAGCPNPPSAITLTSVTTYKTDFRNPFTVYSRSNGHKCGESGNTGNVGETACSYSGDSSPLLELDWKADLIGNAFGVQIKENGSIGYKYIDKECLTGITEDTPMGAVTTGLTVVSDFSLSGVVEFDDWNYIAIRFVADKTYDDCELQFKPQRSGKLMLYVNGLLKLVKHNFKEIILKSLFEDKTKQQGVPYNISLGGGSQGLIDSVTFDGKDPSDMNLQIEESFAGSFIGDIAKFRYYNKDLGWCGIKNNYNKEKHLFQTIIN